MNKDKAPHKVNISTIDKSKNMKKSNILSINSNKCTKQLKAMKTAACKTMVEKAMDIRAQKKTKNPSRSIPWGGYHRGWLDLH
mmetsp:Transcript_24417/g.48623  ORF Transcript_24417/g.48623 Transcript_24417/m.48623 type:complete len:83 (+) Transcript_24417:1064-1312(+)